MIHLSDFKNIFSYPKPFVADLSKNQYNDYFTVVFDEQENRSRSLAIT